MGYMIKEVAAKLNLTAYTLRYYEKAGLLPFVKRDDNGNRVFEDNDLEWVMLICCLRDTGMSVGTIKCYVDLCLEGDSTMETRRQMIVRHKLAVEQRIEQMNGCLARINKKLGCYEKSAEGDGSDVCNPARKS